MYEKIAKLRAETPGCSQVNHLNNAGASLMVHSTLSAIKTHLNLEMNIGGYEAADFMQDSINKFYVEGAKLLGCKDSNIAYTNNATDSFSRALSSIRFESGDVILTSTNDYISNFISFISIARSWNLKVITISNSITGEVDLDDCEEKMKKYNPRLVAITHIPTNSGLIQPIVGIGNIVKDFESIYLVDACQSLGQIPVNAKEINCHFLSGTMRKFLRGPRGAGILYVSDKALELGLEPLFIDMRGGRWQTEKEYSSISSAKRFEDWEFAYALLLGSTESLSYCNRLGLSFIEQRNTELRNYLLDKLREKTNARILDKGVQKGNIITLAWTNKDIQLINSALKKALINTSMSLREYAVIDFKEKGVESAIRVSPHYFNTYDEIEHLVYVLANFN